MDKARLLLVGLLSLAGALAWKSRTSAPALDSRRFVAGLPRLQPDLTLGVATLDFVKTVAGESPKTVLGLDLGTTRAVVSAPARVHFALDLSAPEAVELRFDRASGVLAATFPDPKVSAVEVFDRYRRDVVSPGWGRLEALSGRALTDRLARGLADGALDEAESPASLALVRERTRPQLERLLADYAARAGAGRVRVVVRFRSDAPRT